MKSTSSTTNSLIFIFLYTFSASCMDQEKISKVNQLGWTHYLLSRAVVTTGNTTSTIPELVINKITTYLKFDVISLSQFNLIKKMPLEPEFTLSSKKLVFTSCTISNDEQLLAAGTFEGWVFVYDLTSEKREPLHKLKLHNIQVERLLFSPEKTYLASAASQACLTKLETQEKQYFQLEDLFIHFEFSKNEEVFAYASTHPERVPTVGLKAKNQPLRTFSVEGDFTYFAMSDDGKMLLFEVEALFGGTVNTLTNIATGKEIKNDNEFCIGYHPAFDNERLIRVASKEGKLLRCKLPLVTDTGTNAITLLEPLEPDKKIIGIVKNGDIQVRSFDELYTKIKGYTLEEVRLLSKTPSRKLNKQQQQKLATLGLYQETGSKCLIQ